MSSVPCSMISRWVIFSPRCSRAVLGQLGDALVVVGSLGRSRPAEFG
jgi:hypothetical protein